MRRLAEESLLQLEARNRLYRAVLAEPGIHLSEAARRAGLAVTHARYHLAQLARSGMVSADAQAGFVRYYARERTAGIGHDVAGRRDKSMLDALRRRGCLHVALVLLEGPMGLGPLASRIGKSRPTAHFHVERLVALGIVQRRGDTAAERTYALADRDEVLRLLVRYPPPRPLVAAFESLWDGLALPAPPGALPPAAASDGDQETTAAPPPTGGPSRLWRALAALLRGCRLPSRHAAAA